jgi:hypothetical protein
LDDDDLAPEYLGRNKTQLDKITDFANCNLNDPQIAELLPQAPTNTRSDRTVMGTTRAGELLDWRNPVSALSQCPRRPGPSLLVRFPDQTVTSGPYWTTVSAARMAGFFAA